MLRRRKLITGVTKLELGCGFTKREGFFGIDILPDPVVDLVMDIEKHPLPFADNSIEHIYTSHTFEHLTNFRHVLREIARVCKPGALLEIWTPYGKSDDGMLFGHFTFMSETSFKHICYEYDRFYLGDTRAYFNWEKSQYCLYPGILKELKAQDVSLEFALKHMFNIALEWGVFLRVVKGDDIEKAPGPQYPMHVFGYGRDHREKTNHPADILPAPKTRRVNKKVAAKKKPASRR